jgi:hypothetical protein
MSGASFAAGNFLFLDGAAIFTARRDTMPHLRLQFRPGHQELAIGKQLNDFAGLC